MFLVEVAVLVEERLLDWRRRGAHNLLVVFLAHCLFLELILFQHLQTFVSVVAFARKYPRYASRHTGFTAATMLAVS